MKQTLRILVAELFQVSLVTYLGLQILETVKTGYVSDFFDVNLLLTIVAGSGIVTTFMTPAHIPSAPQPYPGITKKLSEWEWYFLVGLAAGGGFLVYYKTQTLGTIAIAISVLAGAIIALLSYLLLTDQN